MRSLADPSAGYSLDLGSGARLREIEAGTLPARVQAAPGTTDYRVTLVVKYKTQR